MLLAPVHNNIDFSIHPHVMLTVHNVCKHIPNLEIHTCFLFSPDLHEHTSNDDDYSNANDHYENSS